MRSFLPLLLLPLSFTLSAPTAEFKIGSHTFTLPDGYEIERVAGPPLVNRPIVADFDEEGRLYVADSSGSSDKVEKQLAEKPHRIVRLVDLDGDGRFDKNTVFADQMMFPEGVLWHDGAVYSGAPPSIWKLEDTNGDGVADRRSEWFQGKTLTGCANDLHGPYLGLDGYIYWCKGAFAKQTHERPGRPTISDSAAHIFRCRTDGSDFDSIMSGGMDNPVEIVFTPTGEPIFTTTFFTNPQAGKRDALVHAIYGGVYPKMHNVIEGITRTGDVLPPLTHLGPAVPSGLARYASTVFGPDFQGNLFSTQFNLHKVQRHILQPAGATFQTRDIDFLVSDSQDFHPTDVLEDADGSLLVLDTGGWYKLCCPTSQLGKPDILGAIYRVRRTAAPRIDDPRGLRIHWPQAAPEQLTTLLGDTRPAVRKRAIAQLSKLGNRAIDPLIATVRSAPSTEARRNALWSLTRLADGQARDAVRLGFTDKDESVQQVAIYSAGLHRDRAAFADLIRFLKEGTPALQRNAAASLGRIGDAKAVPELLNAAAAPHDRIMEHALIYALIEVGAAEPTRIGLHDRSVYTRRAAMIALDQMEGRPLRVEQVSDCLTTNQPVLRDTAVWIVSRRPEWGAQLSDLYRQWLAQKNLPAESQDALTRQLSQLAGGEAIQKLLGELAENSTAPRDNRLVALKAMGQASVKNPPAHWAGSLEHAVKDPTREIVSQAIAAIRVLFGSQTNRSDLAAALLQVARDGKQPNDLRLQALAAMPGGTGEVDTSLLQFLYAALAPDRPLLERSTAAGILGRAHLTEPQLFTLTDILKDAGPLEFGQLLGAFDRSTNEAIGLKLISSLRSARALRAARPDLLQAKLSKYPATVQNQGQELLHSFNENSTQQRIRLEEIQASLPSGDIRRGQSIFNSAKAACSTCHAIGYLGGQIGPDMTRIGSVRNERDLLESIIYPSASFVRSYEPMTIVTRDGEEFSGIIRRETGETVSLTSGPTLEQQISRANISEIRPGTISIMPEGLDQQLSKEELADLLAFLKSLK